ncbi:MAG TPA: hypothetical protein VLB90_08345 [Pseudomonadales bacterium]|nr:hypothetical protein [Pseudomonadales bacterium]
MKPKDIDQINEYLNQLHGREASFGNYIEEHDCLVIGLYSIGSDPVGVSFIGTAHISGPIRWPNNRLQTRLYTIETEGDAIEVFDDEAGFSLKCYGPVRFGDTGKVIPTT